MSCGKIKIGLFCEMLIARKWKKIAWQVCFDIFFEQNFIQYQVSYLTASLTEASSRFIR
jgi:hypothetical protein